MKNIAVFGCGDFLRTQSDDIKKSSLVRISHCFDPDKSRAEQFAELFGGTAVSDADSIFTNPDIDAVALFVPPWIRRDLFLKAAESGKHVIATKPFGATPEDCAVMKEAAVKSGIKTGVIYGRTADVFCESFKDLFEDGRLGKLALYRQDWNHAYPQWNQWATDPEKNGGPFMDAMIHNLNAASYLMGKPVAHSAFFSDRLAHPEMKCADTEGMVVRYEGGGLAHLFITWAADLATHSTEGNDREHIDLFYLVTDKGYRLTKEWSEQGPVLKASREGETETILCTPLSETHYDGFAKHIDGAPLPRVLIGIDEASRDISLARQEDAFAGA